MLNLSDRQMRRLGQSRFVERLRPILREHCTMATEGQDDAALDSRILALARRAERWGLVDEQSAALFVATGFQLGDGFDERLPAMRQVLGSDLPAHSKAQALQDFSFTVLGALAGGIVDEARQRQRPMP